jgi:hypothetical protein
MEGKCQSHRKILNDSKAFGTKREREEDGFFGFISLPSLYKERSPKIGLRVKFC